MGRFLDRQREANGGKTKIGKFFKDKKEAIVDALGFVPGVGKVVDAVQTAKKIKNTVEEFKSTPSLGDNQLSRGLPEVPDTVPYDEPVRTYYLPPPNLDNFPTIPKVPIIPKSEKPKYPLYPLYQIKPKPPLKGILKRPKVRFKLDG